MDHRYLEVLTIIALGCSTLISANVEISTSYTGGGGSFLKGSSAKLTCSINPYKSSQTWKVDSVSVSDCGAIACAENASNPARYSFLSVISTSTFIFTIDPVTNEDDGNIVECSNGTFSDSLTIQVTVCGFDECCRLLIVTAALLLIHIVLGLLLFVTWKGKDNSTDDKYFTSPFEYLIILCVSVGIVMIAIYIWSFIICLKSACLCSKIVRVLGYVFLALLGIHIVLGGILLYELYCRKGTVSGKDEKCSTSNASCIRSTCSAIPVAGLFVVCQWLVCLYCSKKHEPDPPAEFTLIDGSVTETCIGFKWKPGFDGGYPQTFMLTYEGNGRVFYSSVENSEQEQIKHTLRNLSKGTYYSVMIIAQTKVGQSSLVGPLYVRTKGYGVPYRPTDFKIIKVKQSSVTVQWKPGNDGGYDQEFILKESEKDTVVTLNDEHDPNMSYIFPNVPVENNCQFSICAGNEKGTAPPVCVWTKSKPNTPTDFKLSGENSVTESSITVEWKPGFDGGFPQTFKLCYEGNGNTDQVSVPDETREDTMTHTFEKLSKGTKYTISIFATNQEGDSLPPDQIVVKTKGKAAKEQKDSNSIPAVLKPPKSSGRNEII